MQSNSEKCENLADTGGVSYEKDFPATLTASFGGAWLDSFMVIQFIFFAVAKCP